MKPNPYASWELRLGDPRLCNDVSEDPNAFAKIVAVGIKIRNRIQIGREVRQL
jgi:hypothetical protein